MVSVDNASNSDQESPVLTLVCSATDLEELLFLLRDHTGSGML